MSQIQNIPIKQIHHILPVEMNYIILDQTNKKQTSGPVSIPSMLMISSLPEWLKNAGVLCWVLPNQLWHILHPLLWLFSDTVWLKWCHPHILVEILRMFAWGGKKKLQHKLVEYDAKSHTVVFIDIYLCFLFLKHWCIRIYYGFVW